MKRALIVEDWSRFNRAVLEIADDLPPLDARKSVPQQPRREPTEPVPEPGDTYGLIARHKWRKHA